MGDRTYLKGTGLPRADTPLGSTWASQNKAGTSLYVKAVTPNDRGVKIFITEE